MKSYALHDQVDELVRRALSLPNSMDLSDLLYLQAQLARYACLLCSAAVEQALMEALSEYAGLIGDFRLKEFVGAVLKTGANPTPDYLIRTLNRFDNNWGGDLERFFDANGSSDIKSIVNNRNRIAHGEPVSLGMNSIRAWSPSARALSVEIIRITRSARP